MIFLGIDMTKMKATTPEVIDANNQIIKAFIEAAQKLTGRHAEDKVFVDLLKLGMRVLELSQVEMVKLGFASSHTTIGRWVKGSHFPEHDGYRIAVIERLTGMANDRLKGGPA